jgi:hypothetical protein
MSGHVLENVVDPAFLASHPVTFVETHDDPQWLAGRGGEGPESPGLEERIEQLRSLGYIDRPEKSEGD